MTHSMKRVQAKYSYSIEELKQIIVKKVIVYLNLEDRRR